MSNATTRLRDEASKTGEKAKETMSKVGEQAKEAAQYVGEKADDAAAVVGGGIKSLAGTVRENQPESGVMKSAAATVADTLESTGRYLEKEGLTGMSEDVTETIRRNPIAAVLVGIGIGFLLARITRS
jgi:hypothetical protein